MEAAVERSASVISSGGFIFPTLGTVDTDVADGTGECERDVSDEVGELLLDILLCRLCAEFATRFR